LGDERMAASVLFEVIACNTKNPFSLFSEKKIVLCGTISPTTYTSLIPLRKCPPNLSSDEFYLAFPGGLLDRIYAFPFCFCG